MTNKAPYYVNEAVLAARTNETPQAKWQGGANGGASNAVGIGIATDTDGIAEKDWTLLDQSGAARTPQNSQHLGVDVSPINLGAPTPNGDGLSTYLGEATMPTQDTWVEAGAVADFTSWQTADPYLGQGAAQTWQSIACNDDASVAIAVGSSGVASRSLDGGVTWAALTTGLGGSQPATTTLTCVACLDGALTFMVGAGAGYSLITDDGGDTWANLPDGLGLGLIGEFKTIVADASGNVLVSISGYSGAASRDSGLTWAQLTPEGLNSGLVTSTLWTLSQAGEGAFVAVYSTGDSSYTTDAGATWEKLPKLLGVTDKVGVAARATAAGYDGANAYVLFARAEDDDGFTPLARSNDHGATWEGVLVPLSASTTGMASDTKGNTAICAPSLAPAVSTDFCSTWNTVAGMPYTGTQMCASKTGVFIVVGDATNAYRSPAIT